MATPSGLFAPMRYTITYVSSSARPEEEITLSKAGAIERRSGCLWRSARDAGFPQAITIDLTPDTDGNQLVSRLEIVVHEKMVPRELVLLIASTPETQPDGKFVPIKYVDVGHIAFASNDDSNHHARERKVIDFEAGVYCEFIKLQFPACYQSKWNHHDQVAIVDLRVFTLAAQAARDEKRKARAARRVDRGAGRPAARLPRPPPDEYDAFLDAHLASLGVVPFDSLMSDVRACLTRGDARRKFLEHT